MVAASPALPDDMAALRRLVVAREAELAAAQAELAQAKARETSTEAIILQLRLAIEKMRRELYGQRSERSSRLLDQLRDAPAKLTLIALVLTILIVIAT